MRRCSGIRTDRRSAGSIRGTRAEAMSTVPSRLPVSPDFMLVEALNQTADAVWAQPCSCRFGLPAGVRSASERSNGAGMSPGGASDAVSMCCSRGASPPGAARPLRRLRGVPVRRREETDDDEGHGSHGGRGAGEPSGAAGPLNGEVKQVRDPGWLIGGRTRHLRHHGFWTSLLFAVAHGGSPTPRGVALQSSVTNPEPNEEFDR